MTRTSAQKNTGVRATGNTAAVAGGVLLTLGAAQFLKILDTSGMNASSASG